MVRAAVQQIKRNVMQVGRAGGGLRPGGGEGRGRGGGPWGNGAGGEDHGGHPCPLSVLFLYSPTLSVAFPSPSLTYFPLPHFLYVPSLPPRFPSLSLPLPHLRRWASPPFEQDIQAAVTDYSAKVQRPVARKRHIIGQMLSSNPFPSVPFLSLSPIPIQNMQASVTDSSAKVQRPIARDNYLIT